jgi:hypothetical protein
MGIDNAMTSSILPVWTQMTIVFTLTRIMDPNYVDAAVLCLGVINNARNMNRHRIKKVDRKIS